jgi:hypothetical protein
MEVASRGVRLVMEGVCLKLSLEWEETVQLRGCVSVLQACKEGGGGEID